MLEARKATEYYLRIQDFDYKLPPESIAASPAARRDESRLMILRRDRGDRKHARFSDLPRILRPNSLLIVNDTRVMPARLHGTKATGGRVEVLLVRQRRSAIHSAGWSEEWDVLVRGLGAFPVGARLSFDDDLSAELLSRGGRGAAVLSFVGGRPGGVLAAADRIGAVPLPPYIEAARRRAGQGPSEEDRRRYQTVYARAAGAVAAPTAGLHFTLPL